MVGFTSQDPSRLVRTRRQNSGSPIAREFRFIFPSSPRRSSAPTSKRTSPSQPFPSSALNTREASATSAGWICGLRAICSPDSATKMAREFCRAATSCPSCRCKMAASPSMAAEIRANAQRTTIRATPERGVCECRRSFMREARPDWWPPRAPVSPDPREAAHWDLTPWESKKSRCSSNFAPRPGAPARA